MKKFELFNNMNRTLSRAGLQLKKHSPEILIVAGVIGTVASAVMACKATTKLSKVVEDSKEELDKIHDYVEEKGFSEEYTEDDSKKDLAIMYTKTGVSLVKLYAPAVALGALSLTAILTSNNILRKRNIALVAAYTAVDKSFKEYRGRVVERFGQALDKELRFNVKAKEVEETVVDEKTGEEKEVKTSVNVADPNTCTGSVYAKFFDSGCLGWEKDSEYNLMYLRRQQDYANDLLKKHGYLFLNDVYEMLGIPRTKAGQIVGWVYDEKHPVGDNYVDFGIYDLDDERKRDFVNGYERTILLDFNVDGEILNLI